MSKYFDTIGDLKSALDSAFPGVVVDVRSINSARALAGVRTMVFVSWTDGPTRADVAAVVDRFRSPLASLRAELVVLREFSAWARATIAPGPAREPGDFWVRSYVQDFDLRPFVDFAAWFDRCGRELRIAARVRALASV